MFTSHALTAPATTVDSAAILIEGDMILTDSLAASKGSIPLEYWMAGELRVWDSFEVGPYRFIEGHKQRACERAGVL